MESTISYKIKVYLKDNMIPLNRVSKDTDIPEDKLSTEDPSQFSADEFLRLCKYLNLRPESLRDQLGNEKNII